MTIYGVIPRVRACSGTAGTATGTLNLRLIGSMGALFVLLGLVAFAAPPAAHTPILGFGFGGLHLIFGILIGRANHGE